MMPEHIQEKGCGQRRRGDLLKKVGLAVLTLNPGPDWTRWLEALGKQSFRPARILDIDSGSVDGSPELSRDEGLEVHRITKEDFGHGKTRQLAVEILSDVDIIVFMTQDAILADSDALMTLVNSLEPSDIGAAFGRQLPRIGANPIETHARLFNYPEESRVKSLEDVPELGIKTPFFSNSYAAYKRKALMEVGGFPDDVNFAEDVYVASRLLLKGWKIAYVAESKVYHSHDYSLREEFGRYVQVGRFYGKEKWIGRAFGKTAVEGKMFVLSELKFLAVRRFTLIPMAFLRSILKFIGYHSGRLVD